MERLLALKRSNGFGCSEVDVVGTDTDKTGSGFTEFDEKMSDPNMSSVAGCIKRKTTGI